MLFYNFGGKTENDFYTSLALKWAPIDYQYIRLDANKSSYNVKKDLVVPVDLQYYGKKDKAGDDSAEKGSKYGRRP
jgi:hypothetical protein